MKPDFARATSLVQESRRELRGVLLLPITEETASHVLRGVYELVRMLGKAVLVARGVETKDDHKESIDALLALAVVTTAPLAVLDELRKKRHRINYYGQRVSAQEARSYVENVRLLYPSLLKAVRLALEDSGWTALGMQALEEDWDNDADNVWNSL